MQDMNSLSIEKKKNILEQTFDVLSYSYSHITIKHERNVLLLISHINLMILIKHNVQILLQSLTNYENVIPVMNALLKFSRQTFSFIGLFEAFCLIILSISL